MFLPNPVQGNAAWLAFELKGGADAVACDVFSKAESLALRVQSSGAFAPGWNTMVLDLGGLANGVWYARVEASRADGSKSAVKIAKLMILR